MRDVSFHAPTTLDDAFALMTEFEDTGRIIAGGTALVVMMKQSLLYADHLISLARIPGLDQIRQEPDGLHIGALVRHRELELSPIVRYAAPFLIDVYSRVATIRIRNAATVGGGLAHADPAQDPPAALIALNASVSLVSKRGERRVPVADFFSDYYETAIEPGELLAEVIVPPMEPGTRTAYTKYLPRTADDYATVAAGVAGQVAEGVVRNLRVALIAAGPTPVHATNVEAELEGKAPTPENIRRAAEAVVEQVDPITDVRGSAAYKRDMAVVFTRRALEQAFA